MLKYWACESSDLMMAPNHQIVVKRKCVLCLSRHFSKKKTEPDLCKNVFVQFKSLTSSPRLQISELLLQSRQLEDENGMLSEKDARNIAVMEDLRQQLAELIKENDRRESVLADEKNEVSCV